MFLFTLPGNKKGIPIFSTSKNKKGVKENERKAGM